MAWSAQPSSSQAVKDEDDDIWVEEECVPHLQHPPRTYENRRFSGGGDSRDRPLGRGRGRGRANDENPHSSEVVQSTRDGPFDQKNGSFDRRYGPFDTSSELFGMSRPLGRGRGRGRANDENRHSSEGVQNERDGFFDRRNSSFDRRYGPFDTSSELFGMSRPLGRGRGRGRANDENRHSSEGVQYKRDGPFDGRIGASDTSSAIMVVPVKDIGKIIGKRGCTVKGLEGKSGARIHVVRYDEDDEDEGAYARCFGSKVKISGTEEARRKAQRLIEELIHPPDIAAHFVKRDPNEEREIPCIDWAKLLAESEEFSKKRWAALPPITKNFYVEAPEVASASPEEVEAFRLANNNIQVNYLGSDGNPPPNVATNPVTTFEEAFENYPEILNEIYKNKFEKPSPIQSQAWPILLQGQDLIGIAQTGTGKTLAFLLPAMIHIDSQPTPREKRTGPSCLVLAPTRELAQQIECEAKKYHYRGIKCVCIYGGGSRREQIKTCNLGVEIVIATPGRLDDLVMNKVIDLNYVTFLVLDEADRMLDMGFEPQINKVLLDVRPDRQTVMTSATWPEWVHHLPQKYMTNPFQVFIGSLDLAATHTVTQRIILCSEEEKREKLLAFFGEMEPDHKVIVFVGRKAMVDHLASDFALMGINLQSIHGDREQCDREEALEEFRDGTVHILIATDVAARGLDIKDVTHIFNYDFPRNVEEYVHRVGRTGRAGRNGESITLVTRNDWRQARKLINILEEANQEVPEGLYSMADRFDAWKLKRDEGNAACGGDRGDRRGGGGYRRGGGGSFGGSGGFGGGGDGGGWGGRNKW